MNFYKLLAEAKKKKLDTVDKDELDGAHDEREDGDIDNDGDEDSSDKFLHKRRKAISKAISKSKGADVEEEVDLDEVSKAQQRALTKASEKAQPKDKVSLKKAPWAKKKEANEEVEELEEIEELEALDEAATPNGQTAFTKPRVSKGDMDKVAENQAMMAKEKDEKAKKMKEEAEDLVAQLAKHITNNPKY